MTQTVHLTVVEGDSDTPSVVVSRDAAYLRAQAKSDEQARAGNLPRLVKVQHGADTLGGAAGAWTFTVAGRGDGSIYIVAVAGSLVEPFPQAAPALAVACSCPAGRVPRLCWHVVHVLRALDGAIGIFTLPEVAAHLLTRSTS